jgi:di/tripeptidase
MRLMIIDADGAPILNLDGKMAIRFGAGMNGVVNLIINAQQLEFREAGEYAIEVAVDGIQVGSSPFYVRRRELIEARGNSSSQ